MLTTLQSPNEKGLGYYAVPESGPMDSQSAALANAIAGNTLSYPVIECTGVAPTIQFLEACHITITGAESGWTIDNEKVSTNSLIAISRDSILKGGKMTEGFRSYIAISGKIHKEPCIKNFVSTPLKRNDLVLWQEETHNTPDIKITAQVLKKNTIKIRKGPEFDFLHDESKQLLISEEFEVSQQTNRMGSKLNGPQINCNPVELISSVPIFPGIIQCTPSGKLIIVLQDGQRTGGYPRIAYIRKEEIPYFNQLGIGEKFSFSF